MTSFFQKNFLAKVQKTVLTHCKLFDKFILKVKLRPKKLHPENLKRTFYVNIKIIFGLHVPFAINFMFELKMSF